MHFKFQNHHYERATLVISANHHCAFLAPILQTWNPLSKLLTTPSWTVTNLKTQLSYFDDFSSRQKHILLSFHLSICHPYVCPLLTIYSLSVNAQNLPEFNCHQFKKLSCSILTTFSLECSRVIVKNISIHPCVCQFVHLFVRPLSVLFVLTHVCA